jgi:peptidylprolyl isomerase
MKVFTAIATGLIALLLVAGCGSSDPAETTERSSAAASSKATEDEPVPAYTGAWTGLKKVAGEYADRLLIPRGPSPEQVVIRDLKVGTGPPVQPGDAILTHYASFHYGTGTASEPFWGSSAGWLTWGTDERVQGWESGLKGARKGTVRELIVPSSLAYGHGPLVYVVAIDKIRHG